MAFVKQVEDFICEKCGASVTGNGFTNHCISCLWSKHVDNDPGDRASTCGGMMEPFGIERGKEEFKIVHQCEKCGVTKRNSMSLSDNFDAITAVAKKAAERMTK